MGIKAAADLFGVIAELTNDHRRKGHLLALQSVVADRALLGIGDAERLELVQEPFGHIFDIFDVAASELICL